jgi:hypothetical protein
MLNFSCFQNSHQDADIFGVVVVLIVRPNEASGRDIRC